MCWPDCFPSCQVSHQAELQPGRQPGEQLPDGLLVSGSRRAALPVLHLLRGPPEAPLLWPPLLWHLLWPDRQPGLRGHRGLVWLPLPHVQIRQPARRPGSVLLRVLLWALQHPAGVYGAGARESLGVKHEALALDGRLVPPLMLDLNPLLFFPAITWFSFTAVAATWWLWSP